MDAFVSHSSKDNPTAKRLESELEAAGLEVWTDLSDMPRGPLVDAELLRNLRASDVLLLLWSKAAKTSNYVAAEWLVAFHEEKLVVPCVLRRHVSSTVSSEVGIRGHELADNSYRR